jgi:predicted dehydrogenase
VVEAVARGMHILLTGAGQLGSRYLQSIVKTFEGCDVTVVDPSPASLAAARARMEEAGGARSNAVVFADRISRGIRPADLAIVATTADVRLEALSAALEQARAARVLLEKVLFQDESSYAQATRMLTESGVPAWVNTPRRSFDFYAGLRREIGARPVRRIDVAGGDWGLACNAVHFLDLAVFLAGSVVEHVDTRLLGRSWRPGKRERFMEIDGTLRARLVSGTEVSMTAMPGTTVPNTVMVGADTLVACIDEAAGKAFVKEDRAWETRDFRLPLLSEYAGPVLAVLLRDGETGLPGYAESADTHLSLVRALSDHTGSPVCPIT